MTASGDDAGARSDDEVRKQLASTESRVPPRPSASLAPPSSEYSSGIQELSRGESPTIPVPRARRGSVTISLEAQSILTSRAVSPADARGAAKILERVLRVPPRAAILLLASTEEEASLGAAFLSAANELEIHPVVYLVEPAEAANPVFLRRLEVQLEDVAACVVVQGPTPFPAELREVVASHRAAAWVDVPTEAVARQALRADLGELQRLGLALSRRAASAPLIEINSGLGANAVVEIDPARMSMHRGGVAEPGAPLLLPAGQLAFACVRADGTLSADGGVWLPDGTVVGRAASIELELVHGFVARVSGSSELEALLESTPSLRRVGALGFGTNTSLVAGVGARALDLCLPGAYLLLGELDDPRRMAAAVPRRPGILGGEETWMVRGRWARELV